MTATNPAPGATWGRLDQGYDGNYSSKGAVAAYDGTIVQVRTGQTGWPGNGTKQAGPYFVLENADQSGPDYTRRMYYAEGARCLFPEGTKVVAGQKIGEALAQGGTGAFGNFEIGPAGPGPGYETLTRSYGSSSAGPTSASRALIKDRFYPWMRSIWRRRDEQPQRGGRPVDVDRQSRHAGPRRLRRRAGGPRMLRLWPRCRARHRATSTR